MRGSTFLLVVFGIASVVAAFGQPAGALFTRNQGQPSNTFAADVLDAPAAVTSDDGYSQIGVSWTATGDTYASGYRLFRATVQGGPYTQVAQVTPRSTTTYTDTPSAGYYYYVLRSYYQNWESNNSSEVSASLGALRLSQGSYVGNGADNRSITGTGFAPDVVIVKCDCGQAAAIRTALMPGDAAKIISTSSALQADVIQSLDANGFTIGTSNKVNQNTDTYYWTALKAGTSLKLGSYAGNGADNRSISGVGFQPDWVVTMGDGEESWFRPSLLTGDASYRMEGQDDFTNRIQAIQSDGFQLGSNANVNASGVTFYYIAFKSVGGVVAEGSYAGNNTDNRSIAVGFQPAFVWVKRSVNNAGVIRIASMSGDNSAPWDAATAANNIQAIEPGGFQVGTHDRVNNSAGTYFFLALRDPGP